jgi:hypothetical protein
VGGEGGDGMMRLAAIALLASCVTAEAIECPVPGQPCKWISLNPQEEAIILQERGILATAAEGRKVDLGEVSLYFRKKIEAAPQGEVKPVEQPKESK